MNAEPVIFHVDIDAFYASVEQRDRPELAGRPVIVGAAPGHRGVVSACSYEARRYGVRSAMPISEAYARCPHGVYLPVRMSRYLEVSRSVMALLSEHSPEIQQISVDEAFLDMTGTRRLLGEPEAAAARIKARVREQTGLAISVGIAANRYLAKLASDHGKPDGLCRVLPGQEIAFLDGLRLEELWGVGRNTAERLRALGIRSVAELRARTEDELARELGAGAAKYLHRICRGADPGIFSPEPRSRSVSAEVTFPHDTADAEQIRCSLLELAEQVVQRMLADRLQSRTVRLKLRFADFSTTTVQHACDRVPTSTPEVIRVAERLLASRWDGVAALRLVGVGFCDVVPRDTLVQGELFDELLDDPGERHTRIEQAVRGIRSSIGQSAITRASLLHRRRRK